MENLKQKIRNYAGASLIGLASLVGSGCNEQLADSLVTAAWQQTTVSAIDSTIRNEIEGPRGSTTYVNVQEPSNTGNSENNESQSSSNIPTPQIYSTEIYNLDRNEKEDIGEVYGRTFKDRAEELIGRTTHPNSKTRFNYFTTNFLITKMIEGDFPEGGYKIIETLNGNPIKIEIAKKGYNCNLFNQQNEILLSFWNLEELLRYYNIEIKGEPLKKGDTIVVTGARAE